MNGVSIGTLPKRIEEETRKLVESKSALVSFLGVFSADECGSGLLIPPQPKRPRLDNQEESGDAAAAQSTPMCPLLSKLAPCIPSSLCLTPSSCIHNLEEDASSIIPAFSMMCCMLVHSASCKEGCTVWSCFCLFCSPKSTVCGSTRW